jgi:hypothetical protein
VAEAYGTDQAQAGASVRATRSELDRLWVRRVRLAWLQTTPDNAQKTTPLNDQNDKPKIRPLLSMLAEFERTLIRTASEKGEHAPWNVA